MRRPWDIDRPHAPRVAPGQLAADVVVVGAGLTGLAAARALLARDPALQVAVLEAQEVGTGGSGASGGIVLEGTERGDDPRYVGCIEALASAVSSEAIDCHLELGGCWELGRGAARMPSSIAWRDHGTLRVIDIDAGGTLDPGLLLTGLWRAVERRGGHVFEHSPVQVLPEAPHVVLAAGAAGLPLARVTSVLFGRWTYALAVAPVDFAALGWSSRRPFYAAELPYLWGRPLGDEQAIFGGGLGTPGSEQEAEAQLETLLARVRGLHPTLERVRVTHSWAGPVFFTPQLRPLVGNVGNVHYATGYGGQGIALSFCIAELIADAIVGPRR